MLEITPERYPVSVVIERREKQSGRWPYVDWKATGVLPYDGDAVAFSSRLIHSDAECQRFLCSPFVIELNQRATEGYWANLTGANPSLFVMCMPDETENEIQPYAVTADYEEIIDASEMSAVVLSAPIPPQIYLWLEQYVVENHKPKDTRRRKRKRYEEDSGGTPSPSRNH